MSDDDWSHEETDDPLYADLSPGGVLLGSQPLKRVGFNFCRTAADITATLAASVTLPTNSDDDACKGPAA